MFVYAVESLVGLQIHGNVRGWSALRGRGVRFGQWRAVSPSQQFIVLILLFLNRLLILSFHATTTAEFLIFAARIPFNQIPRAVGEWKDARKGAVLLLQWVGLRRSGVQRLHHLWDFNTFHWGWGLIRTRRQPFLILTNLRLSETS